LEAFGNITPSETGFL